MKSKRLLTGSDVWVILAGGVCQVIVAWVMAAWREVYPPIPMFISAVLVGLMLKGRPQAAARAALIAGLVFGWAAELAYVFVRASRATAGWQGLLPGELTGMVLAETVLYAALLGFFAAFVAWGGTRPEFAAGQAAPEEDDLHHAVPFSPAPVENQPPAAPKAKPGA